MTLADYLVKDTHHVPFKLVVNTLLLQQGSFDLVHFARQPLVSCLMVTRGNLFPSRFAVDCFRRQAYENRELVLVCDGPGTEIERYCQALNDEKIRIVYADPSTKNTLGALRNLSLGAARGEWVCQWDDDDLYHPQRIALGMAIAQSMQVDAFFLNRWLLWSPTQRKIGLSGAREWEGSMLARKDCVPAYPAWGRGEDTAVMHAMFQKLRIALVDAPWLYTYIQTGANTWTTGHFDTIWNAASLVEQGEGYDTALGVLAADASRLPYDAYAQDAGLRSEAPASGNGIG